YFPIAPGTAGSVVGVLLDLGLRATVSSWLQAVVFFSISAAGVWAAGVVERQLAAKDPSVVVIDEVAGMLLALYLLPLSWLGYFVGFLVFRLFDIVKPFPARQSERLPGGIGIMVDDLIAGLYTHLFLRLVSLWWPALLVG
ncbi:hypothetical protein LCGC14_2004850, partial [marine sediment metagenome]